MALKKVISADAAVALIRDGDVVAPCKLVVVDDVVAQSDAFVADKNRRTGDQLPNVVLRLAAERAREHLSCHGAGQAVALAALDYSYFAIGKEWHTLRA